MQKEDYRLILGADALVSFGMGAFSPFWIIYVQNVGESPSAFGGAIALKMAAYALAAYAAGAVSDKVGRKLLILIGRIASAAVICGYLLIDSVSQLYALQILFGLVAAIDATATTAFLGDITKNISRGKDIGRLQAATGIAGAAAMALGGVMAEYLGVEVIFYAVALFFLVSALLVVFVREER